MERQTRIVVYVDVDDTFVRSVGTTRIPIPGVISHIRELHRDGAELYCWSSGGAEYARGSAREMRIEECFAGFLPKPHVILDDQEPASWRRLVCVHPAECQSRSLEDYRAAFERPRIE